MRVSWVNRFRRFGEIGLADPSSAPHRQPNATATAVAVEIEALRRARKWSAERIAFELGRQGVTTSRRTVSQHLVALGLNRCRFIDFNGGKRSHTPAHHRALAREHDSRRCEEGRPDPRRRWLAFSWPRITSGQGR